MTVKWSRIVTHDRIIVGNEHLPLPAAGDLGMEAPVSPGWTMFQEIVDFDHVTITLSRLPPGAIRPVNESGVLNVDFVLSGRFSVAGVGFSPGHDLARWPTDSTDIREPVSLSAPTEILSLRLPLAPLAEFGIQTRTGWQRCQAEPSLREMALGFVLDAHERADDLSPGTRYFVSRLVVETAATVILAEQGFHTDPRQFGTGSLLNRALHMITLKSSDSHWTPHDLAADMQVSLRQLQRVFSKGNRSIADEIRKRRTELATSLFRDESYTALSVAAVARLSGFSSTAALRRSFRRSGLPLPSELRHERPSPRHKK